MSQLQDKQLDGLSENGATAEEGVYTGERSDHGLKNGLGCLTLSNGSLTYHGQWSNGLPNGLGCLASPKFVYFGQMRRGRIEGLGQMTCSSSPGGSAVIFVGQFSAGVPDGRGVLVFADGSCGLPRQEGAFSGWRLVRQERCPELVTAGVRCAARARALADEAAGAACGCDRSAVAGLLLRQDFYSGT